MKKKILISLTTLIVILSCVFIYYWDASYIRKQLIYELRFECTDNASAEVLKKKLSVEFHKKTINELKKYSWFENRDLTTKLIQDKNYIYFKYEFKGWTVKNNSLTGTPFEYRKKIDKASNRNGIYIIGMWDSIQDIANGYFESVKEIVIPIQEAEKITRSRT